MKKRKRKAEKKMRLLDKSSLRLLTPEQRKQLDFKHTTLYPPILFAENARHGLDKPSTLFDFENTVSVIHWAQRAKMDLLDGEPSGRYKIGARIPTTSIYREPEADRKELERQATRIVEEMEAEEAQLKKQISLLRGKGIEDANLIKLAMNHENIPDENIVREFNRATIRYGQDIPLSTRASLIARGGRSVSDIREVLNNNRDNCEELCRVNTLGEAYRWVSQAIYCDTESILDCLCRKQAIIPFSIDEQTEVFNRFVSEGKPHIDKFAPYARVATQLYLTIFLYLVENKENSSPRGALRDCEYLYYAIDTNVIFISSDMWHKKCIEEIPLLKGVRERFIFLPPKNKDEKECKKVLNSMGIKT